MALHIQVDSERIAEVCRKYHVARLAFFGSVLRDDFRPDSDVDILVWFEPGYTPGMFGLVRMEMELSEIIGRKVDLRTPEELSRLFRDEVVSHAEVQYAA